MDTEWKLGTWNCRSIRFVGYEYALLNDLKPRNFDVVALYDMCWKGAKTWENDAWRLTMCQSGGAFSVLQQTFSTRRNIRC